MSTRTNIVNSILTALNANTELTGGLIVKFDELSVQNDSMCLSFSDTDVGGEVFSDVTGTALSGKFLLEVYYRVISKTNNTDDLNSLDILDSIVEFIKNNFRYNSASESITDIKVIISPRLKKSYINKTRDFFTQIIVSYERMV
jgi:hypothetical protein